MTKADEYYKMAKTAQKNYGVASGGQRDLADLLDKLEEIKWEDLLYRVEEQDIVGLVMLHMKKISEGH